MLNQKTKNCKKQAKELTIVAIYKFKTNGKLNGTRCTLVRNGEGKEHKVWTHTNGCASSCDCEGFTTWHKVCYHIKSVSAIEAARKAQLLAIVNAELAKVNAPAATAEELAATQAKLVRPDDASQAVYFIQLDRRSAELAKHDSQIKPVATPTVRKVSQDWLLGNRCNAGTFSGKPAA